MMSDQEDSKRKDRASKREVSKVYDAIVKANLLGPSNDIELETGQRMSEILNSLSPDEFNAVQKAVMAASNKLELVLKSFSLDYGLTNAETGLLRSQLEGKTIVDHACANGVSVNTARTHMRHLLDKTGAANQLDLLRMVRDMGG